MYIFVYIDTSIISLYVCMSVLLSGSKCEEEVNKEKASKASKHED